MENQFLAQLATTVLLADGAMGTMLHSRGIGFDQCFDALNLTHPALVADIHRDYVQAGAQIILTNTFGANRYKLAKHGLADRVAEINRAGVELARRVVAAAFRHVWIAGDVGPLGVRLAPFGRVQPEEARQAFREQIQALVEAGADLIVIETIADRTEIVQAIQAAREVTPLPIVASMTFTRDDRTVLGDDAATVARAMHQAGADVIGANCSSGPSQLLRLLRQMRAAVPEARFWTKPNAGWPEHIGGRVMYAATPEYFRDYALEFRRAGAHVIGGCCGTTPAHIAAMYEALQTPTIEVEPIEHLPTAPTIAPKEQTYPSHLARTLAAKKFAIAVELDPPRGPATQNLIAAATLMHEAGADVIDVADTPMARMRMSAWAVCDVIQRQVGIETTLHFPTRGRNLLRVQGDLLAAHALGIRNVFVVMGDPTAIGDYPEATDNYDLVPSGLIKLIKQGFNLGVDHAGISIGQPTTFFVGAALNPCSPEPANEIKNLVRKLNAGADFFLTQPIFDPQTLREFFERLAAKTGQPLDRPVLVGILPLASGKHANFLHNEVPGIVIPESMRQRMERAKDQGIREGIRIALELIEQSKPWAAGIYVMPQFNRYDVVAEIIEAVRRTT